MLFTCHHCGFSRELPDSYAGKSGNCPHCKGAVTLPPLPATPVGPAPEAQAAPAPAADATSQPQRRYSLAEFVKKSAQKDRKEGIFELESPQMLEINLDGMVWTKMGSMVAYNGPSSSPAKGS